ncbi:MAG TPA: hypothetical protein VJ890_22190 [Vineibacter sp.]|nr:hypothetical protein [Vineibacter sp.]
MMDNRQPGIFSADAIRFGLVLAGLSIVVMLFVIGARSSVSRGALSDRSGFFPVPFGAAGMFMGGAVAYHVTRRSMYRLERIILVTLIAPGVAFVAASLPFLGIFIIGAFMAWFAGVLMFGVQAFVLAAVVSIIHVLASTLVEETPVRPRQLLIQQRGAPVTAIAFTTLIGIGTLILAIKGVMAPEAFR